MKKNAIRFFIIFIAFILPVLGTIYLYEIFPVREKDEKKLIFSMIKNENTVPFEQVFKYELRKVSAKNTTLAILSDNHVFKNEFIVLNRIEKKLFYNFSFPGVYSVNILLDDSLSRTYFLLAHTKEWQYSYVNQHYNTSNNANNNLGVLKIDTSKISHKDSEFMAQFSNFYENNIRLDDCTLDFRIKVEMTDKNWLDIDVFGRENKMKINFNKTNSKSFVQNEYNITEFKKGILNAQIVMKQDSCTVSVGDKKAKRQIGRFDKLLGISVTGNILFEIHGVRITDSSGKVVFNNPVVYE